jgi:hypothetical protein
MVNAAPSVDTRTARLMAWIALILVLATDAAYIVLIRGQGALAPDAYTVPFVAGYLLVMAALLMSSLARLRRSTWRMPLRAAAAGGLLVLGVLAIFSVGLPLVIAGALATGATVRTLRGPQVTKASLSAIAAAVVAVVVLVAGFEITQRVIVCPATGTSGGGGTGFVTGPYYYDCVNGRLTFHSGSCSSSSIDSSGKVTHPSC